jgi:glycosyltransferase involved in cell wall biosynthesis
MTAIRATRAHEHLADAVTAARTPVSRIRVASFVNMMHVGGTELNALRTVMRLDPARFDVTVLTLAREGPLLEQYREAGVRVVPFPLTSLYDRNAFTQGLRLYRFLRGERIDVLHCHDLYSNVFATPWGRIARVPAVIASRRWIHAAESGKLDVANRISYRFAHRVLGNGGAVARMLRDDDGVGSARIIEIPNFVDDNAFRPLGAGATGAFRTELDIPPGALVIGCIARLAPVKDHATLIRAVAALVPRWPALYLVLVGDGPLRTELEALTGQLGISDRVRFAGYRPNQPNLHQAFDISTLSSLSEGFPNSIVEAMAAGRPVVATNVGGNGDAVRRGTGLLVPPNEPAQMASAIERLLVDPGLRGRMGAEARRVAHAEYHVAVVIPRLEAIYVDLLGSR